MQHNVVMSMCIASFMCEVAHFDILGQRELEGLGLLLSVFGHCTHHRLQPLVLQSQVIHTSFKTTSKLAASSCVATGTVHSRDAVCIALPVHESLR